MAASESSLDVLYFKKLTKLFGRKAFLIQSQKNKQTLLNYFKTFKNVYRLSFIFIFNMKIHRWEGSDERFDEHFW